MPNWTETVPGKLTTPAFAALVSLLAPFVQGVGEQFFQFRFAERELGIEFHGVCQGGGI